MTAAVGLGAYDGAHPLVIFATIVVTIGVFIAAYARIGAIRQFLDGLGPYGLALFHAWRIIPGLAFVYYGAQGWLPTEFTNPAGWGDFAVGVLALVLIFLPRTKLILGGFHLIGLVDLINAVSTGIPIALVDQPSMQALGVLPMGLIPIIGVPLSAAIHLIAFYQLTRRP